MYRGHLRLLQNKNFLKLFGGRVVTNMGDSLYYVGAMWLVYELSGSSFYTGLAGFFTTAPRMIEFLIGPLVDRWSLRRTLAGTQFVQAGLLLVIPIVAFFDALSVKVVLVVMPLVALLNQFTWPAQKAALPKIVEEESLVKANSLFSAAYQGIDMGFNAVGGFVIAALGAVSLYVIDSVTFLVAALSFVTLRFPQAEGSEDDTDGRSLSESFREYKKELKEGFTYVLDTKPIVWMSLRAGVLNFASGAMLAVLPAFSKLQSGAKIYGILLAAISIGMLAGNAMASYVEDASLGLLIISGDLFSGVTWILAVVISDVRATVILFGLAWVPVGLTSVVFSAALQAGVPDDHIGRVSSLASSLSVGSMPVGSLVGGILTRFIPTKHVVLLLGPLFVSIALYWVFSPRLRSLPKAASLDFSS